MEYFKESKDERHRDVLRTPLGNIKLDAIVEEKSLEVHPYKISFIV
jgi:hypothetical protein